MARVAGTCPGVCRACLKEDVRMRTVRDTQLIAIYEDLTNTKYNADGGMPRTLCSVCYSQLRNCLSFSASAHRSERLLMVQMQRRVQTAPPPPRQRNRLSVSTTQHLTVPGFNGRSIKPEHSGGTTRNQMMVYTESQDGGTQNTTTPGDS